MFVAPAVYALDWPTVTVLECVHTTHRFAEREVNSSSSLSKRI